MRKTLLLIGGTGFFGKSILDYLSFYKNSLKKKFNKIIILSRGGLELKFNKELGKEFKIVKITSNILKIKKLPKADFVIYGAILKNFNEDNSAVKNYLKLARIYHFKSKILYISSGAIYGEQPKSIKKFKENYLKSHKKIDFKIGYKKKYSKIKLENEKLFEKFGKTGANVSIARCFSFVGQYLPMNSYYVVGNLIKNILNNESLKIKSNYQIIRSYMYSDDLVKWLFKILFNSNPSCPIYNVGSNTAVEIHELAVLLAKKYNLRIKSMVTNNRAIDKYIPNIDKAKKQLGLKNKLNSFQAIIKTIDLLKKNYETR
jgi:dTDP-glucose 4,6-dehydratase